MSKFDEKIIFYKQNMDKMGLAYEDELFNKVTRGLGPSIFKRDAASVSTSDEKEIFTVKHNFLIKKLGLEDGEYLDKAIVKVAETEQVSEIVVGIPYSLSKENSSARDDAMEFIAGLGKHTSIKITGYDERFTTVLASKKLRETGHDSRTMKSKIDAMAATEILQQFLDS